MTLIQELRELVERCRSGDFGSTDSAKAAQMHCALQLELILSRAESREQVARARLAPGSPEHAALWEAINAYVAACNGRLDSTSVARQCAVVTIEGAIEDAIAAAAERNER